MKLDNCIQNLMFGRIEHPFFNQVPFFQSYPNVVWPIYQSFPDIQPMQIVNSVVQLPIIQQYPYFYTPTYSNALVSSPNNYIEEQQSQNNCLEEPIERRQIKQKQKPHRNLNSNILKHFIKYILNNYKAEKDIQTVIFMNDLSVDYGAFMKFMKLHFKDCKNYIRPSMMSKFCFENSKYKEQGLILRITLRKFLKWQCKSIIFNSNKIKQSQKVQKIKNSRKLERQIFKDNINGKNHLSLSQFNTQ